MGELVDELDPGAWNSEGWNSIYPLVSVHSPWLIFNSQPEYLAGEVLFHILFLCSIVDVRRHDRSGNKHFWLWLAALLGGSCIELLTILPKQIGNFYHSRAMLMLFGNREPVYMLFGCYIWFQYISIASVWPLRLSPLAEASYAALLGSFTWGLLDLVGLKYL